jgi:hypothetical protein
MKKSMAYLAKAMEYLEKCELESPYKNAVDIENAKRALQLVELEHKIEEARLNKHPKQVETLQKQRDEILAKIC